MNYVYYNIEKLLYVWINIRVFIMFLKCFKKLFYGKVNNYFKYVSNLGIFL